MKVGDYVRTNGGRIGKVTNLETYCNLVIDTDKGELDIQRIIKSSPNIIDLIEVGDYVNGYLVKDIDYAFDDVVMNNKNARIVPYIDCNKDKYIDDIKSIVTKEQFEAIEYKVEE